MKTDKVWEKPWEPGQEDEAHDAKLKPVPGSHLQWVQTNISRRDYFAAHALNGFCACSNIKGDNSEIAKWAVIMADALIAELDKNKGVRLNATKTPPENVMTQEDFTGVAARLWCLPQHSHKVMDVELCKDISLALNRAYLIGKSERMK